MITKFLSGDFVDFNDVTHTFVICGKILKATDASVLIPGDWHLELTDDRKGTKLVVDDVYVDTPKYISIGISICNPGTFDAKSGCFVDGDVFDLEIGKKQAEGRANKRLDRSVWFAKGGMCTEDVLDLLMANTFQNLVKDPGMFIPGYNHAQDKHLKACTEKLCDK